MCVNETACLRLKVTDWDVLTTLEMLCDVDCVAFCISLEFALSGKMIIFLMEKGNLMQPLWILDCFDPY